MNSFSCLEVGIVTKYSEPSKFNPNIVLKKQKIEIVDCMQYEQDRDIFRCYEIKVSKQDFYSKCKKTFVGNYNYYVMPKVLFEQVKNDVPENIGVLNEYCNCLKRPKRTELKFDKEKLLISLIKSLNRENYKNFYKEIKESR